jgi:S-formylglutathione hydrolase FrmB
MSRWLLALVVTAATTATGLTACSSGSSAQTFHSAALGRTMRYQAAIPSDAGEKRFPVVYLLHGHGGQETDWFTYSAAKEVANSLGLIVVTPDGANSWYLNTPSERWEDYITRDLIQEVERRWPVRPGRASRAVAGLSMGGYGAMNIALRQPGMFALAASMSGALDTTRPDSVFSYGREREVNAWFGPPGSATRRDNDVYRLAAEAQPSNLPYLYVDCGVDDPWFRVNREFVEVLKASGVAHEFHEEPGDHNWAYWDRQVRIVLALAAKRLGSSAH